MKTQAKKITLISGKLETIENYVMHAPKNLVEMLYNSNYASYEANIQRVKNFVLHFSEYKKILEKCAKLGEGNVNIFALRQRVEKGLEFGNIYLDALNTYNKDTVIDAEREHPVFLPTETNGYIFWDKPNKKEINILEEIEIPDTRLTA